MKEKNRILNDNIKAKKVKLIWENWDVLWDMSLQEALNKASSLWLDLMQMSQKWDEAVVKMLDYWKFLYKQKKQEQKNKQKTKSPDLKTLKITFKIWEHDLNVKKNQAEKFSKAWHPLKVILQLKWRENHYTDIAFDKIKSFSMLIEDFYKLEKWISKNGNNFVAMYQPK